jgi:hypothetical protein
MIQSTRIASRIAPRTASRIKNNKVTCSAIPRDQDVVLHIIQKKLESAVETAMVCHRTRVNPAECVIFWDTVEELTKAVHDHLDNTTDPLETWCETHPSAPECRIFD